jgi:hypothetical protein
MRALSILASLLALLLVTSCSNNTGPTAAALSLSLSTPNDNDGAVLLTITGGPVDSVEATAFTVYTAKQDPETLRLIVTGNLGAGPIARIHIPDGRQASRYSARISQVASRLTYAPRNPNSYSARLLQ